MRLEPLAVDCQVNDLSLEQQALVTYQQSSLNFMANFPKFI